MKEMIEQYISSKGLYKEAQSAVVIWWEIPVRWTAPGGSLP